MEDKNKTIQTKPQKRLTLYKECDAFINLCSTLNNIDVVKLNNLLSQNDELTRFECAEIYLLIMKYAQKKDKW